jgi:hypothetical protein
LLRKQKALVQNLLPPERKKNKPIRPHHIETINPALGRTRQKEDSEF